jgi:hypothetical protein
MSSLCFFYSFLLHSFMHFKESWGFNYWTFEYLGVENIGILFKEWSFDFESWRWNYWTLNILELRILTYMYIERVICLFWMSKNLGLWITFELKILDFKFGYHVISVFVENTLRDLRTNSGKQVQRKCI